MADRKKGISKFISYKNNMLKKLDKKRGSKNFFLRVIIKSRDWVSRKKRIFEMHYIRCIELPEKKALYININKNAMTTIRTALEKETSLNFVKIKKDDINNKYKDYFKFAFVRNPYDRAVSCWKDKTCKQGSDDYINGIFLGFLKYEGKFYPKMSFKEFAKSISYIPDNEADDHFKSQYLFLTDSKGRMIPDFIGKVENLHDDYKKVCKTIGIKSPEKLPHKRKSKRKKSYREYYDNEARRLVKKRYSRDLKLFNYEF